jgi:hypothetical protein
LCEETEGCIFKAAGRLYGKFTGNMNKDEMIELIRESWRVLGIIGLVIIGILSLAVMGSKYVGRHVGSGKDQKSVDEALESSKAEAIEHENEVAKQMVADAHKSPCPTCDGSGWLQDEDAQEVLKEVEAVIDKVEDKELEQAGVNVEKRTEIKLTKKEQKAADAAAKKAAQAEAKAEKARIKQEKKAAKAAAKKGKQAASDAPAPTLPPAGGDDIPPPPDDDPDLESLEQLGTLDDLDMGNDLPNPMLLGGEMDAAAALAAISAGSSAADAPPGGDEFDMESTVTLGEEKPMTKKEKKAAEKAAKKAEKEAKKKNKKKGKDPTGKVMEAEFDSPKPPADETADNPLVDAGLE